MYSDDDSDDASLLKLSQLLPNDDESSFGASIKVGADDDDIFDEDVEVLVDRIPQQLMVERVLSDVSWSETNTVVDEDDGDAESSANDDESDSRFQRELFWKAFRLRPLDPNVLTVYDLMVPAVDCNAYAN